MFVCCECCVLSGRGLCDQLITSPEESYRLWCVVVCDLETSWMRRPWPALGCSATKKTVIVIEITSVNFILCWTCVACYTFRFRPTFIEKLRLSVMSRCFQMMYTFGFAILLIVLLIFVILWCIYYVYDEKLLNQLNNYRGIFGCGRLIHARVPKIGRVFLEVVRTTCGSGIIVYNSN